MREYKMTADAFELQRLSSVELLDMFDWYIGEIHLFKNNSHIKFTLYYDRPPTLLYNSSSFCTEYNFHCYIELLRVDLSDIDRFENPKRIASSKELFSKNRYMTKKFANGFIKNGFAGCIKKLPDC
jgi:hypothetical protein